MQDASVAPVSARAHSRTPIPPDFTLTRPLLGYETHARPAFALNRAAKASSPGKRRRKLATHHGQAHLLNIGQTGSCKTIQMIATALTYEGSLIVVDVGGDICRATARYREQTLGQRVHVIDPFGITDRPAARLDPVDTLMLPGVNLECEAERITASLGAGERALTREPFWVIQGSSLIAGVLAHFARITLPQNRSIQQTVDLLFGSDVPYTLTVLLDVMKNRKRFEYESIAAFLQLPDGQGATQSCVLGTAHTMLSCLRSPPIRSALGPTTVNLNDLLHGEPTTIYLCMPVQHLSSHGTVLRLWLETLLATLIRRTTVVDPPTLVLADECASLGRMESLLTITTFCRNRSVKLWTAWQSLGQIKNAYGQDWSTLLNNCSGILVNAGNALSAHELSDVLGVPYSSIAGLKFGQQLVCETSLGHRTVEIPRYWRDGLFKGRFDPLPRFATMKTTPRHRRPAMREVPPEGLGR